MWCISRFVRTSFKSSVTINQNLSLTCALIRVSSATYVYISGNENTQLKPGSGISFRALVDNFFYTNFVLTKNCWNLVTTPRNLVQQTIWYLSMAMIMRICSWHEIPSSRKYHNFVISEKNSGTANSSNTSDTLSLRSLKRRSQKTE